ncbi:MAG TPA: hypothetical protein PKW61_01550, partial [Tenuifilaceae bacterium]|nr:hypothetical protein [Tenuifilaceae bacterium]
YFFHDEKVSKKSRQNYASSLSAASQEFLQKLASPFCEILKLPSFTLTPARSFANPTHLHFKFCIELIILPKNLLQMLNF